MGQAVVLGYTVAWLVAGFIGPAALDPNAWQHINTSSAASDKVIKYMFELTVEPTENAQST